MNNKICRQCGEVKPTEQFRKYYGGRQGTYTMCRSCERINSRAKYLERKGADATPSESEELAKIYELYEIQRACGLRPPRRDDGRKTKLVDSLDTLISNYSTRADATSNIELSAAALNPELSKWLTCELTEEPDYYLDEVYEDLKAKYRPVLRIDQSTLTPIYDDTYKAALEQVLSRFNNYEDSYYEGE